MNIDTFFEKWQIHINSRYADHVREPMLTRMYNDLKALEISIQSAPLSIKSSGRDETLVCASCDEPISNYCPTCERDWKS